MAPEASGQMPELAGLPVRDAMAAVARFLMAAGIEGAARDARLLLLEALELSASDLLRDPLRILSSSDALRLSGFAERRARREPVARIVGARGFYGRTFRVTPATLDPRPCTETVVEAVLEIATGEGWRERPIRIIDVGTGSGALLVTLLAELPLATGVGTDISDDALTAAQTNATALGVAARAEFVNRRNLVAVEGPFDVLVSNPPYIPSADIAGLDEDVRMFDPMAALDGGVDGLDIYRALSADLCRVVPAGWAFFEVGAGQADDVADILRADLGPRVASSKRWRDLGQHTRCVAVQTQR